MWSIVNLLLLPLVILLPVVVLYFTIKLAVKNAIRESREENRY
jgi:hypothetical protein